MSFVSSGPIETAVIRTRDSARSSGSVTAFGAPRPQREGEFLLRCLLQTHTTRNRKVDLSSE
jgi:hypothetical protein